MSAIFGIIYTHEAKPDTDSKALQDTLRHRATDGAKVYEDSNAVIGNFQLITSVYQRNEVFLFEKYNCIITSDSRLDNRNDLIHRLALNNKKEDIGDSELILEAYKKWDNLCTDYLEGEFAFVIWNKETRKLFAATDHIGFRSFYYYSSADTFIFSSEIKGILALKKKPHSLNKNVLIDFLKNNFDGSTFDTDVYQLKGASQLSYQSKYGSKPLVSQYWTLKKQGKYQFIKDVDWAECVTDLLTQSVRNRLHTDKPVGLALSGGLDSSFLAGILAKELARKNKPLYTFSHVVAEKYKGSIADERYYIELTAKKYPNIVQEFVQLPEEIGPFDDLKDTCERTEALCYPFIYVDKALYSTAQKYGTGLFFTGFGGDFAISNKGSGMIYEMLRENQYQKAWHYLLFLKKYDKLSFLTALRQLIIDPAIPERFYILLRKYLRPDSIRLNDTLLAAANKKRIFGVGGSVKDRFARIIEGGIIGGLLFNTQKKLSASYGLECTVPMLDKSICEFFMDIPPEQFLLNHNKRSLMRRAMQDYVPEEIQWRKDKSAFSPNFTEKFIESKAYITHVLTGHSYRNARKYINVTALKSDCNRLFLGQGNSSEYREAAFVVMLITFLSWLENKNYAI